MEPQVKELRDLVSRLKEELSGAEEQLNAYVDSCRHNFSKPVYDPVYYPGFMTAGDPPGTMGVDWQGPMYIPERTEKRWKRECQKCGEVEYNKGIKEVKQELPDFGDETKF